MFFNSLLMVKDFGSREFTTDNTFMTNADVPTIAFRDLVENPVNPSTGKPINNLGKAGDLRILLTPWDTAVNNGNTFTESLWIQVDHDALDIDRWTEIPADQAEK